MSEFNLTEFLAMGGYAKYVWSSWVLTIVSMVGLIFHAISKRKSTIQDLQRQAQQQAAREKRKK